MLVVGGDASTGTDPEQAQPAAQVAPRRVELAADAHAAPLRMAHDLGAVEGAAGGVVVVEGAVGRHVDVAVHPVVVVPGDDQARRHAHHLVVGLPVERHPLPLREVPVMLG